MQITVGCDPEIFLVNPNSGSPKSAHGLIPGNKQNPFKVPLGAVQVDGTALEFNIDPALSANEFVFNINTVLKSLGTMVLDKAPGFVFSDYPVAMYDTTDWLDIPEMSKAIGCDPDFDAWTHCVNVAPDGTGQMRTAAGHVHIGWTKDKDINDQEHFCDAMAVARQLDYYIGMPSLIWDKDNRRRKMYGRAGACRVKSYGVEYRVPSNAWLKSEKLQRFVFDHAVKAVVDLNEGKSAESMYRDHAQDVINCDQTDWHTTIHGKNLSQALGLDVLGISDEYGVLKC